MDANDPHGNQGRLFSGGVENASEEVEEEEFDSEDGGVGAGSRLDLMADSDGESDGQDPNADRHLGHDQGRNDGEDQPEPLFEPDHGRVILTLDLDSFYAQVERHRHPELDDRPIVVTQWESIIAMDYKGRRMGINRFGKVKPQDVLKYMPDAAFVSVDVVHSKVSLEPYRRASRVIMAVLEEYGVTERGGIDEVWLDATKEAKRRRRLRLETPGADEQWLRELHDASRHGAMTDDEYIFTPSRSQDITVGWFSRKTAPQPPLPLDAAQALGQQEAFEALISTHVFGYDGDLLGRGWRPTCEADWELLEGAALAAEIRRDVYWRTGYAMSAGIAHNMQLSKICSGYHKPGQQTLVPGSAACKLLGSLPLRKLPLLGGKLGSQLAQLLRQTSLPATRYAALAEGESVRVKQCWALPAEELTARFGTETGRWLYGYLRGRCQRQVQTKGPPVSLMEGKNLPVMVSKMDGVEHWLWNIACNLAPRTLEDAERFHRWPSKLVLYIRDRGVSSAAYPTGYSRACGPLPPLTKATVAKYEAERQADIAAAPTVAPRPVDELAAAGATVGQHEEQTDVSGDLESAGDGGASREPAENNDNLDPTDQDQDNWHVEDGDHVHTTAGKQMPSAEVHALAMLMKEQALKTFRKEYPQAKGWCISFLGLCVSYKVDEAAREVMAGRQKVLDAFVKRSSGGGGSTEAGDTSMQDNAHSSRDPATAAAAMQQRTDVDQPLAKRPALALGDDELVDCPVCTARVPPSQANRHVNSHFDENAGVGAASSLAGSSGANHSQQAARHKMATKATSGKSSSNKRSDIASFFQTKNNAR